MQTLPLHVEWMHQNVLFVIVERKNSMCWSMRLYMIWTTRCLLQNCSAICANYFVELIKRVSRLLLPLLLLLSCRRIHNLYVCTCLPKVYRFIQYFDMFPHKCIDKCFTTYLRPTQALDTCSALLVRQIGVWKLVRFIIRHNRSWAT